MPYCIVFVFTTHACFFLFVIGSRVNGEWRMENGEWRMDNGEWIMNNEQ